MYAEFAHDPKVQSLSEVDQRRFLMVLCLRCSNGDVTLQDVDIAFSLRIDVDSWAKTKQILLERKLINKRNQPTAWDKRQFASDSSAERVSRHRAKLKSNGECNVTSPLQKRHANALEAEAEEEVNQHASKSRGDGTNPRANGTNPRSQTPDVVAKLEEFSMFWAAYPKKVGKGAAEKAWMRAKINGHAADVISAVDRQRQSEQWQKENGQFIPNPATWITQRRWEDELPLAGAGGQSSILAGVL